MKPLDWETVYMVQFKLKSSSIWLTYGKSNSSYSPRHYKLIKNAQVSAVRLQFTEPNVTAVRVVPSKVLKK